MSWRAPRAAGTTLLLLVVAAASGCRSTEVDELRTTVEELKAANLRMSASLASLLVHPAGALAGHVWSAPLDWDVALAVEHALAEEPLPADAIRPVDDARGRGVSLATPVLFEPGSGELTPRGEGFLAALARHAPRPRRAALVEVEVDGADPIRRSGDGFTAEALALGRSMSLLEALGTHDLVGPGTMLALPRAGEGEPRIQILWSAGERPAWTWGGATAVEATGNPWTAMHWTASEDPDDVLPYHPPGATSLTGSWGEAAGRLEDSVVLHDEEGKQRVRIELDEGTPRMRFFDDEGRTRIELGLDAEGEPYLRFLDQDGEPTEPLP